VLLVAIDIIETKLGESYDKQLRKIPRADISVNGRIQDISEDICRHLTDQLKTSRTALQIDKAADVV